MRTSILPAASPAVPPAVPAAGASPAATRARHGQWLMVAGGLLLGTLGVFVEEAGQDPLTTVWFRCAFGGAALLLYGVLSGRLGELRLAGRAWGLVVSSAALMVFNWALFFAAIQRTSIGVATVVFHVQPLWVMGLGAWWFREKVLPGQWVAAAVALAGLALATGLASPQAWQGPAGSSAYLWGLLMCLGGSLSYAGVTLLAKASAPAVTPFALAWWQCLVGVLALAWWPWVHGWPAAGAAWAWLAGLGAIHTGLAYVVLYAGMARLPAARIAVLQFVYPAAAILMDWLVYGRALGALQMLGVLLMGGALWVVRAPRA